jgi:hypothetical protein
MQSPQISLIQQILPYLLPILVIQVILRIVALIDLVKKPATRGPKWMWALIIIFLNIIGPVIYFVAGRKEE